MDPKKNSTSIATNPFAQPRFRGDKKKLIGLIDGAVNERVEYPDSLIPPCFSDPNLESGVCNPLLPLKSGEPHLCALHKSCLVAKLLSHSIRVDYMDARNKPYQEVLAEADQLFDQPIGGPEATTVQSDEDRDRQILRGHALSISLQPPVNPFRKNSVRRLVLDILSRDWTSLKDLKAILMSQRGIRRLDLIVHQVTSVATQEHYGYRIIEAMGAYKAFKR